MGKVEGLCNTIRFSALKKLGVGFGVPYYFDLLSNDSMLFGFFERSGSLDDILASCAGLSSII